ncbi:carbamoyltransferase [Vibrio parahaemolyticus]|uniref:carbamoyltransferase family protein n=1 Tax=Vibrio parahaemolyticus TaxID=670 RepID=UPI00211A9C54|nr:carbamoyltransferase [Vibrio parahaemolyticus]EGR3402338.1 hypothetical protein [Vibrio parahaemolyticus]MCQ9041920.1 carbamoyltransferase [Vibrio parahaemolyticus]
MYILGISAFYHDSAAALLCDGHIVSAAQEERFTRIKQDSSFPANAIEFCLNQANIRLSDVDAIYYYENPNKKFLRVVSTQICFSKSSLNSVFTDLPNWVFDKFHVKKKLKSGLLPFLSSAESVPSIHYVEHHESHAASAFYPSPYEDAAILCVDGVGEWATTSAWQGNGNKIKKIWDISFPHSIGLLYSAFTYYCGFKVDSGEYKMMGLAPYGDPKYYDVIIENLVDVKEDGSFWLDMDYFDYATGKTMITPKFEALFGRSRREPESDIDPFFFDVASSIQRVTEDIMLKIVRSLKESTKSKNLCLSGGVALNCVCNGKLMHSGIFDNIWVQPASGDSGGSLGAALLGWYRLGKTRTVAVPDQMQGGHLGTEYSEREIAKYLDGLGAVYTQVLDEDVYAKAAKIVSENNVVGWFQGRMEFGPRALGARSIIGDPRNIDMQRTMNLKIKNRESFRPFAPIVLEEHANTWFEMKFNNSYMLFAVPLKQDHRIEESENQETVKGLDKLKVKRSSLPAITHVDYSARVQTVNPTQNPHFYKLLSQFNDLTGCPVLVNTSFNVRGEPIVESPKDAYQCFMRTEMDYLILGNFILSKKDQPHWNESVDWRQEYVLD